MARKNEYLFGAVHSEGSVATDRNEIPCNGSVWMVPQEQPAAGRSDYFNVIVTAWNNPENVAETMKYF